MQSALKRVRDLHVLGEPNHDEIWIANELQHGNQDEEILKHCGPRTSLRLISSHRSGITSSDFRPSHHPPTNDTLETKIGLFEICIQV
jgi:hypothetical protein